MRTLLALLVLSVPVVASVDAAAAAADAGVGVSEVAQKLDALYAQRHVPESYKELQAAIADALKSHPTDYDVLWRAARLKYWQADGASNNDAKRQYGKEGWALAERAVKQKPDGLEGHYYAAINIGSYSQAVGILKALGEGLEGKFNDHLDRAIRADPGYDNAGPLIAKGRYYFELPWPKRDLRKSAAFLQRAIKQQPLALRAYLYLAETQLRDGDEKKAKDSIDKVFAGSEAYDIAEARRVKQMAKPVKSKIEEELR